MAFEGKIKLSWEDHIKDGYVTVYGEAVNEEGETKQASEDIYLEDFSPNDVDDALYSIYKEICFDTLYDFINGWISIYDPAYDDIYQIIDNDEGYLDEETRQIYFDEDEIESLEDHLIKTSKEYSEDSDEDESED